ncbi:unnamed protein product, partial [Sphagnum jensenii]
MGGGGVAATRALHGSIAAAAAAVFVSAAATVDIPDKLHLKATPMLFYAVPPSMPLPPLPSLSSPSTTSCSCFDFDPFSIISDKNLKSLANSSSTVGSSLSSGSRSPLPGSCCATPSSKDALSFSSTSLPSCSPCLSSSFSLAQGAPTASSMCLQKRSLSFLLRTSPNLNSALLPAPHLSLPISSTRQPPAFSTSSSYSSFRSPSSEQQFSSTTLAFAAPSLYALLLPTFTEAKNFGKSLSLFAASAQQSLFPLQTQSPFAPNLPVSSTPHSLHMWHVPMPSSFILNKKDDSSVASAKKPALTVVLLGWLGAQQKHLKKYAEWYNARGIHAVTFVVPMTDVLTFKVGGKAEEHVDRLAHHLALWLTEQGEHANGIEGEKQLIFHTFSNTGWLTYGVILEKLQERGDHLLGKIKGCVVDSAPAADPDPQVWASGFSAALLKKRSSATKEAALVNETKEGVTVEGSQKGVLSNTEVEPNGVEAALLSVLAGFFSVFLKLPAISERLSKVVTTLSKQQPQCPQLYIYSTADKVIPVKSVEAFIEQQRKAGHVVRSCNLQSSPHVDHFRSHPQLYSEQLSNFLKECCFWQFCDV